MNRFFPAALALAASLAVAGQAHAQSRADEQRFQDAQQRFQNELRIFQSEYDRYLAARDRDSRPYPPPPPPGAYQDDRYEGGYDPSRYYRSGPSYQPRVLSSDDRVYRGSDGRYYCKRNDGTTGLIVGAAGGAILGNVIDGGHSRAVGTLLGGALGALAGRSIDQSNKPITCQ
ncbi:glycine zipper 2TM domain-containing protein [Flavisphingomonas formosensis]|uniref:glycine zipper 2TM domain-containing protein n=1 Tax=Flavisphingomonas formosensis TaxID=861534 RepID=UPI0012F96ACE|nr:glycine zipper 2TM domain-containing protein [Sphingomonas formosensis]